MALEQQRRFMMQGGCSMKLLVFSDLHLDHKPNWSLPDSFPDYDVCVAAGDIDGSPAESIRRLATNPGLRGKPIVFTPGNHEFYGNVLEDAIEEGRALGGNQNQKINSTAKTPAFLRSVLKNI
jgi:hypothetical protein